VYRANDLRLQETTLQRFVCHDRLLVRPKPKSSPPANFAFKLMRPGFGPPLKRLGRTIPARRHAGRSLLPPLLVAAAGAPRCRSHAGPAAQLNVERWADERSARLKLRQEVRRISGAHVQYMRHHLMLQTPLDEFSEASGSVDEMLAFVR
jgi:hypothetical protein